MKIVLFNNARDLGAGPARLHDQRISPFRWLKIKPLVSRNRLEDICNGLIDGDCDITSCFPSGLKMETLDEELLQLLARAGMRYFSLSPESGSRRVLELMNKTADIDLAPGVR